jgi:hypothetical protein
MPGPIVFISHSRVREGRLDDLREFTATGAPRLKADKPRTLAFLPYLSDDGTELAIIHLFADAESFAVHLEGVPERSAVAAALIETIGFEIYGDPGPEVLGAMRRSASASGVPLRQEPELLTGYLRPLSG